MEISLPNEHHFRELKLKALVVRLVNSEDELESRALKNEFYRKLQAKFYDRCHKIAFKLYGSFPDWEETRDDIFQESFLSAFEKIPAFKVGEHWDDKECEKVLLFWLGTIANNKFLKRIKKEKEEQEQLEKYLSYCANENTEGSICKRNYEPTYDRSKFDQVWQKMNPMAKEILFVCMEYDILSEDNKKHLPDDILELIATKYKVEKSTVRQAKRRALTAIRSCKKE